jgi:hypothetical protein
MDKNQIIKEYFASIGRKGGSVSGPTKARKLSREHYAKVGKVQRERWDKFRRERQTEAQPPKR